MSSLMLAVAFALISDLSNAADSTSPVDVSCQPEIEVSVALSKPLVKSHEALKPTTEKLNCISATMYSGPPENGALLKPDPNYLKSKDRNLWRVCRYRATVGRNSQITAPVQTVLELSSDAEICSIQRGRSKGCGGIVCRKLDTSK